MAYAPKYTVSFADIFQNSGNNYVATIFKKDYTGAIYELNASGTPLIIETNREGDYSYKPIIGTSATLTVSFNGDFLRVWEDVEVNWDSFTGLWPTESFNMEEFLLAGYDDFYMEVEKDGNLYWKGWYITNSDTTLDEIDPIEFSMTFSDLTMLKSYEYGDDTIVEPTPATAEISFNYIGSPGNITFDSSTVSGLVIDTTTGGFNRIKNTTSQDVYIQLTFNLNMTNFLQLGEIARLSAIVSNDSAVNTAKLTEQLDINPGIDSITLYMFSILLEPNDGVRFRYDIIDSNPPVVGEFEILSSSGVSIQSIEQQEDDSIRYEAKDRDNLHSIILDSVISSRLDLNIRYNSSFVFQYADPFNPDAFDITKVNGTLKDIYVLKNSFIENPNDYKSSYDVLEGILSQFGLMMYQNGGYWYISDYNNLVNLTSRTYEEYSYVDKSFVQNIIEEDVIQDLNADGFINTGQSQQVRYILPTKYIDIQNNQGKAVNNPNWNLKSTEEKPIGGGNFIKTLSGWELFGYPTKDITNINTPINQYLDRYFYALNATAPIEYYNNAMAFYAMHAAQDNNKYLQTQNPIQVKKGDYISLSFSTAYDARINNAYKPNTKFAVILRAKDPLNPNNTLTYSLDIPNKQFTTTLTYLTSTNIDYKNLKMPVDGDLYIRMLIPWGSVTAPNSDVVFDPVIHVNYAIIQTYKGTSSQDSLNQKYRTFLSTNKFNKDSLELKSGLYMYNSERYSTAFSNISTANNVQTVDPIANVLTITNLLSTKTRQPINGTFGGLVPAITNNIYKNTGFQNTIISGNYRSNMFAIGKKFRYRIVGFEEKLFVMLDYKNDFKQSMQDVVLYSCDFANGDLSNVRTRIITE